MPFLLLMLVTMSSCETLLLIDVAHTFHPLRLFLTISVQAMLMFSDPEDELIGSSKSTMVERVVSSSPISCGIRKSGPRCKDLHVLKQGERSLQCFNTKSTYKYKYAHTYELYKIKGFVLILKFSRLIQWEKVRSLIDHLNHSYSFYFFVI